MLQGDDQSSLPGSQPDNGAGSDSGSQNDAPGGQSDEEVEFSSLSGSTQDRIRRLIRERNDAIEASQRGFTPPPPPPVYQPQNPSVQDAVEKLREVGITTKDDVKSMVQDSLAQLRYQAELDRLEASYDGDDGKPKFTREEYEDFVRHNPQYQDYLPEDVYEKMYKEELNDWRVNQSGSRPAARQSQSLPPRRTMQQEESLTPEGIEEKLRTLPEGEREKWYEKNVDKINAVMGRLSR